MANPQSSLDRFLSRLVKNDPPRAKSLCVSLLGDALAPHGGAIWLGDLIELLAPLGINERLLRTSVFRLVAQNWLQSERHGRRSLYLISEQGLRHTAHASQRIYEGAPQEWNGEWTLVALPRTGNGLAERAELRRELVWEGFGMIAPGLFAHPHTEARAAHDILEKLGIPDRALVLSARDLAGAGGLPHLAIELLKAASKGRVEHVPYKGASPGMADAVGGHVSGIIVDLPALQKLVVDGRLRAIAVTDTKRSPTMPEVPTTVEGGLPSVIAFNWFAIMGPKGLPMDIREKLHKALVETMNDPDTQAKLEKLGIGPFTQESPVAFDAFMKQEGERWSKLIKDAGVQAGS